MRTGNGNPNADGRIGHSRVQVVREKRLLLRSFISKPTMVTNGSRERWRVRAGKLELRPVMKMAVAQQRSARDGDRRWRRRRWKEKKGERVKDTVEGKKRENES